MAKTQVQFNQMDEWYTPKSVLNFFTTGQYAGPFDYDPATTAKQAQLLGIPNFDTVQTDGLSTDWTKYKKIWCNPPFSKKFEFLKKAVEATNDPTVLLSDKPQIFMVWPADSLVTKKFYDITMKAPGGPSTFTICIPSRRIAFDNQSGGKSTPAFGCVVLEFPGNDEITQWRLK